MQIEQCREEVVDCICLAIPNCNAFHAFKAEMEKRADGADASVLIFSLCCANFLAVNGKIAKTFDFSTVLFFV